MGNFLSAPVTDKQTRSGRGNGLNYGLSSMQGWRTSMEDAHVAVLESANFPEGSSIFAVCDGHGGKLAADFVADKMTEAFAKVMQQRKLFHDDATPPNPSEVGSCMRESYLILDSQIRTLPEVQCGTDQSGCTAISSFITKTHIIVANSGDSRSVLAKDGNTVPMSFDHKPINDTERRRIENAGGIVRSNRVNGDLAVSRALGDFSYKQRSDLNAEEQQVSAEPDIKIEARDDTEEFLVIACDGIWDVMTNDDICAFVRDYMMKGEHDMGLIAEEILDNCLRLGSRDNMSVILVQFPGAKFGEGEGVAGVRREREQQEREAQQQRETTGMDNEDDGKRDELHNHDESKRDNIYE